MTAVNTQQEQVADPIRHRVEGLVAEWSASRGMVRLWQGDETLWTSSGESKWLGWLSIVDRQLENADLLRKFGDSIQGRFSHVVLLGMGGSSLCPEVLRQCFGTKYGYPDLRVVDSTDPAQIKACEDAIRMGSTLFISASKSGSTIETSLLTEYFLDRLSSLVGARRAAEQFVAITDPGSRLESNARALGFGYVMYGEPEIGGRYSALSHFGMVPAAAMGLDTARLLVGAQVMQSRCGPEVPAAENPALQLGLLMGAAAEAGRDKLTFLISPGVSSLGTWIEQLVAESTGKRGKGIVPVEGEALGSLSAYGDDRVFVGLSLASESDPSRELALDELARHGHPVVRIGIQSLDDIAQEFFRWEVATAVAGAVLGIDPFDQPDVESAKVAARELTSTYEASGSLPSEDAFFAVQGIRLFAAPEYSERLLADSGRHSLATVLRAHLDAVGPGDYLALLAFVNRNLETQAALGRMRETVRSLSGAATCVGFGPRFLHSTGQLHKGGADNGVFLQIGCENHIDLAVPGRDLTFGVVKDAQALGDFSVLSRLGRRALRVHLDGDLGTGLARLESELAAAVQ